MSGQTPQPQDSPEQYSFVCADCGKNYHPRKVNGLWLSLSLVCKHCGWDNDWKSSKDPAYWDGYSWKLKVRSDDDDGP
jgi:hypothetical protein